MAIVPSYVESVQQGRIVVQVKGTAHADLVKLLGGRRSLPFGRRWVIPFDGDPELGSIFEALRDAEIAFAGAPHGWPPAEVCVDLRDRGLFRGTFRSITWLGPDEHRIEER